MAEVEELTDLPDNGRYDNDFVKLPHTDEELVSSSGVQGLGDDIETLSGTDMKPEVSSEAEPAVKTEATIGEAATSSSPADEFVADTGKGSERGCPSASCCFMKNMDPRVMDLLLWRDFRKTLIVFGSTLLTLVSLALFSVLSVVAYMSLAVLTITFSYRCYWHAVCSVKKLPDENPWKTCLDVDLAVDDTTAHRLADFVTKHVVPLAEDIRRLVFVVEVTDSLKFALVLWLLTYFGACFNGITLVIIAVILLFSLPKVYNMYKVQIDRYADKFCVMARDVWKRVQEKVPALSKKKQE